MRSILISWIGHTDLKASQGDSDGIGPLAMAVEDGEYDAAFLLATYGDEAERYRDWLEGRANGTSLNLRHEPLTSPTAFGEIYPAAVGVCERAREAGGPGAALTFHLSPGTPAMAAVWVILAKTRFPATIIESSEKHGVRKVSVPFDISADFLTDVLRQPDQELERLSAGLPPQAAAFDDIVHRSPEMQRVILRARRVALHSVPVLIEGESGTGKELMAQAIHNSSPRWEKTFLPVNCGAIPENLVESELFGHERGAFSGADKRRKGHFEATSGGTLFLDEIGELPLPAQTKLLRVLQANRVQPVGSSDTRSVDVRVIAATNRTLTEEVARGRFREDLFYRLAVVVLKLPPFRERGGDVGLVTDHLLKKINDELAKAIGYRRKSLSASARNLLARHPWPGNVRELHNTLTRAAIWSAGDTITGDDLSSALLSAPGDAKRDVWDRPLGDGFSIDALLAEIDCHYLNRAMEEAGGNKSKAAKLLGLRSHQTLSNRLKQCTAE